MSSSNPFPSLMDVDGYQRISGTCSDSDEIKVVNGGLVRTVRLVNVATNGARALDFQLTYDAQSPLAAGTVGANWFHSYQMNLVGLGTSVVTATLMSGVQFHFNQVGSSQNYELDRSTSTFIKATLTQTSPTLWLVNFYPNEGYFAFDQNGVLQKMVDAHGNALTMGYTAGQLTSVTESTGGRAINFSYSSGLISGVTDPNGNSYTLLYDGSSNLANVVGPGGCVLTYGYSTPANHLLTSRTDPNNNTYSYSYDGSRRVTQIQDPSANVLAYAYDTPLEFAGDTAPSTQQIYRTILTDARGKIWEYHFDTGGNVWRTIDPQGHWRRFYWSPEQNLLYTCEGSPQIDPISPGTVGGPRDNIYNSFTRNVYDPLGNLLYRCDPLGKIDRFEYDSSNRLISSFPGQGHIGVQGDWYGPFGQDGYLLCAWNADSTDISNLPSYVSSVTPSGVTKTNYNNAIVIADPRAPLAPNPSTSTGVQRRGVGLWSNLGSPSSPGTFTATIAVNQPRSFNLSIYSHALNQSVVSPAILGPYSSSVSNYTQPLTYSEQFGCYLEYEVTDSQGTQTFVVYNNGPGVWASFPVVTTAAAPNVTVTVSAVFNPDNGGSGTIQAQISALTFDPYDSRLTRYTYSSSLYGQAIYGQDSYGSDGDLARVDGPLGASQSYTYNGDGTVATSTDALGNVTQFFYTDSAKNLTQIIDPSGALWQMSYDQNGNLLTSTNPNSHVTTMTYDSKNRLLTTTDALGNVTTLTYDPAGNLVKTTDPLGRNSLFGYTSCNRLSLITDALLGQTQMLYDASGNLVTTIDQRSNLTGMSYDSAGRLTQITQADSQIVKLALDAMDRLTAITTANGTQPVLSNINVTNGANLVRNPSVETANPVVAGGLQAQFWTNSVGSNNRDNTHSHTGTWSLPLNLGASAAQSWNQANVPLPAGGTYLANVWAQKSADGIAANLYLLSEVYSLQHTVTSLSGPTTSLDGTTSNWQQLDTPFHFSVPGDSTFTRFSTKQFAAIVTNTSSTTSTQVWLDDFSITPLSTTYEYDLAGNLEEARRPDGGRTRMYRDRWARVVAWEDSLGQRTTAVYDSRNRLIGMSDPLGNQTAFGYDPNDNLVSLTNAGTTEPGTYGTAIYGLSTYGGSGQETQFSYNSRSLLSGITYQDGSSEQFGYDGAGNLTSYRDNGGRLRTFSYDQDERLSSILYSDATSVTLTYDAVGNVISRLERNNDLNSYTYDNLNRLTGEIHTLGGAAGVAWTHGQSFDAASNRTSFSYHASEYGSAIYGTDVYGTGTATWQVGYAAYGTARFGADLYQGGYDAMNRMPGYLDSSSNQVRFRYDCEARRTQTVFDFTFNGVTTNATYDISGRLLSQITSAGVSSLLALSYGYDPNSNRIGMVAGLDGWDYDLDASNRLVGANLNIWVDSLPLHFSMGSCSGTALKTSGSGITLLGYNDDLAGQTMTTDRWRTGMFNFTNSNNDFVGAEMRQNSGLLMAFPRGFTDNGVAATLQGWAPPYGLPQANAGAMVEHRRLLSGDFDVQIDFSDFQGVVMPASGGFVQAGLIMRGTPLDLFPANQLFMARQVDNSNNIYVAYIDFSQTTLATTDTSGKFRIQRTGGSVTISYDNAGSWSTLMTGSFTTANMYMGVELGAYKASGSMRYKNFTVTAPAQYPASGLYTSGTYDSGQATPTWGALSWSATLPGSTAVQFQLASSNSVNGPWTYLGPTGAASFYTTSGTSIPSVGAGAQTGRYMKYQATLTGPGTATPELTQVSVTLTGTNASTRYGYSYDSRGNMTGVTTQVAAGTATEVRTFSDLNQLLTNAVTPVGGGTTNWTYAYNLDGTLATKFDGTNTYAYTWDPGGDQRLLSMSLNGVTQVAFTYDYMGRMLTRTPYSGGVAQTPTNFEWSGTDVVREFAPAGTYRYYAPQSELITFDYTPTAGATSTYSCHGDALGSVRMITDSTGASVAHYETDAWGNLLASSSDISFGFNYRFIGSLGVRWDATLGMYYMRQRWFDPAGQRFISRDPLGLDEGNNLYLYCGNSPINTVDPEGLKPLSASQQNQIDAAIRKLRELGFCEEADLLDLETFEDGNWLPGNTVGLTSPNGAVIFLKFSSGYLDQFVNLTFVLYHEAQHLKQLCGAVEGCVFNDGFAGHIRGDERNKARLEGPAYSAEKDLARAWAPTATPEERLQIQNRVGRNTVLPTALPREGRYQQLMNALQNRIDSGITSLGRFSTGGR